MIKRLLGLYEEHGILVHSKISEGATLPRPVCDNRDLKPGDCFIAIKGANFDGHDFIPQALAHDAAFCIGELPAAQIVVTDSRKATALYTKLYFGDPSAQMILFGITGTNGKTTTSLMLHQMLLKMGIKAAWIGTLGYKILDSDFPTRHTTPDILQLNAIFKDMLEQGISHVVMEVSSHALALDRVYAVEYDYCLFTNLSRDHLDFHKDMDEYFEAKYLLFQRAASSAGKCIVNSDDIHGQTILHRVQQNGCKCLAVGRNSLSDLQISAPQIRIDGSSFDLSSGVTTCQIQSPLVGDFNIDNLACGALLQTGVAMEELPRLCAGLQPVRGRIESVPNPLGLGIFIDYAHSPDALDNLLKSVEKLPHGRIITVFGAGGDRDKGKRPLMLKAALSHSDAVIVTDDNPRGENPEAIIHDIVKDSAWNLPWWIIRDRAKAIAAAIRLAIPTDLVLICGKGHETYQEIEGLRYDFDDHQVAQAAILNLPVEKADCELLLPVDPLLLKLLLGVPPTESGYQKPVSYRYICTDSRSIKPEAIFFAIQGETFDGNHFVEAVLRDPDIMAVASQPNFQHPRCLHSEQAEITMAGLLRKYLQMFAIYKIALTGSTGKTSTEGLIAQVLAHKAEVLKTAKNENNIIGLCKTILRVETKHRFGIFEIGTNHFGEIALLADTVNPDAGIILNIGPSHLQYFGDENGVFKEKSELFHRALDLRLYPADDPRFEVYRSEGIGVGFADHADFRIHELSESTGGLKFYLNQTLWEIPYKTQHQVINSAFAIVLGLRLHYSPEEIQTALATAVELDLRMQIEARGSGCLIVDCYNANPVSMQSAISFWHHHLPDMPHVAIMGDMLELGDSAELYHRMVGAMLADTGEQIVYSVGQCARLYQNEEDRHFETVEALLKNFPELPADTVILLKASHGIHLEKILPHLRGAL